MTEHEQEFNEYLSDPRAAAVAAALRSVPYEDPPRRIAFVSDKVFEPTWWQRFWATPRWGFASAAVLSGALVFHAATRPPAIVRQQAPSPATHNAAAPAAPPDLDAMVQAAVARATAGIEARHEKLTVEAVKAAEERLLIEHRQDMAAMEANTQMLLRKLNTYMRASNDVGAGQ